MRILILFTVLFFSQTIVFGQSLPGSGTTLEFDGVNDRVRFVKPADMDFGSSQDFTVEFWLKPATSYNYDPPLISDKNWWSYANDGWCIALSYTTGRITVNIGDGSNSVNLDAGSINDNQWHHIAATFDRSNRLKLYIDGIRIAQTNMSGVANINNTLDMFVNEDGLGSYDAPSTSQMDEIRIWNDVRTRNEIRANMCQKLVGNEAGLIHYYRMDDNSGLNLSDAAGSMMGTMQNMATDDWVLSAAPLGDESSYQFNNTPTVAVTHPDGDEFAITNFTGSPDAAFVYLVNESPNNTDNNLSGGLESTRYWGTYVVGGANPSYVIKYNYSGNAAMESNEIAGRMATRTDNSVQFWNIASDDADLDTGGNLITISDLSDRGEFIGGFHDGSSTIINLPGSGTTLDFDGVNDRVAFNKPADMDFGSNQDFTVEFWLKAPTNWSSDPPLISDKDWSSYANDGWCIALGYTPGQINVNVGDGSNTVNLNSGSINDDKWHHIAATFDRNQRLRLYIDGLRVQQTFMSSVGNINNALDVFVNEDGLGSYNAASTAQMDEIRIWNDVRSQNEIRGNMCQKLDGDEANLIHYYRMDDNSGLTLFDAAGSMNGTMQNMAPDDWVLSGAPLGDASNYQFNTTPTVSLSHADGDDFEVDDFTGSPRAAFVYLVNESPNNTNNNLSNGLESSRYWGTFIVGGTSPVYSVAYNYTGNTLMESNEDEGRLAFRLDNAVQNWVLVSNSGNLNTASNLISMTGQANRGEYIGGFDNATIFRAPGSGNTLAFDGVNDRVSFTKASDMNFGGGQDFTVEFWLKAPASWNSDPSLISDKNWASGNNDGWNIALSSVGGRIDVNVGDGSNRADLDAGNINDNSWHHIAVSFNRNQRLILYIDGVIEAQTNMSGVGNINNSLDIFLNQDGTGNYWSTSTAQMDEIRIWSDVRNQNEIRDNMCQKLVGSEANLIHYYRMDDGTGTTIFDEVGSMNGTLQNMTESDWIYSSAPLGDESVYVYNVNAGTANLNIAHANGDDMSLDITSGAASSIHLYRVDDQPNSTSPPGTQIQLSQQTYYGTRSFGSSGLTYSAIYNYDGHPGIVDENTLELAKRDGNGDLTWTQETATLNTVANTLTLTGQTGTEFILADAFSGINPLPIELMFFDVEVLNRSFVELVWQTSTEINNDFFTIERTIDLGYWEQMGDVDGAGNSTQLLNYSTVDRYPHQGVSYYRLKQTDFDGQFSYSEIRSVNMGAMVGGRIKIFPNPTQDYITVEGDELELSHIYIYNVLGVDVTQYANFSFRNVRQVEVDLTNLNPGIYTIKTENTASKVYKN